MLLQVVARVLMPAGATLEDEESWRPRDMALGRSRISLAGPGRARGGAADAGEVQAASFFPCSISESLKAALGVCVVITSKSKN